MHPPSRVSESNPKVDLLSGTPMGSVRHGERARHASELSLVDIWTTWVDAWSSRLHLSARTILSTEELERASRFRFERDERRWIVRRLFLREVLGAALAVNPRCVRFVTGPWGKPYVDSSLGLVHFSLADSEGFILLGVSRDHELGVDVEWVRDIPEADDIAADLFPLTDRAAIAAASGRAKSESFMRGWVRLEAIGKASGRGLVPASEMTSGDSWETVPLRVPQGFIGAAAVAVEGGRWQLRYRYL